MILIDGDGDDAVSGFHQRQLDDYLRFSISKRNAALRDVEIAFRAAKDARLNPGNVYSCEEVSDIIDSISPVVKGDIQKELLHTTHTTALVLCQLFAQAEDIFLDLHIDTAQLENEYLLREMEQFEEAFSTGEKRLKPLSRAITMPALQHVKGEKEKADDRFRRLQIQCTTILKEKTAYGEEIERLKAEKMLLAKQYSSSSGKSTAAITDEISSRHLMSQTELATMKEKTAKLEQELEETRQQLHLESQKVSRAERELLKKVQTTTPFVNMKKMLKQKNDQLKALRDIIARVAPEELPPEPRIDDERE
ncbi:leucine zipper transcription [Pelomyxa schiedti]|nr:leucine zipper transcription [Pelomyxa schiedti]